MGSSKRYTIVEFGWDVDSVKALYINGELEKSGDYYHDKISYWLDGFEYAIKLLQSDASFEKLYIHSNNCEDILELGDSPPDYWPDEKYILVSKTKDNLK